MTVGHLLFVGLIYGVNPALSSAQTAVRVRVAVPAAKVLESPRSWSDMMITAPADTVFEVIDRDGDYYWVLLPADNNGTRRAGYINATNVEIMTGAGEPRPVISGTAAVPPSPAYEGSQGSADPADPDRSGFTILAELGAGVQHDDYYAESAGGLAGLNLGLGAFLTRDLALMFRFSGTTASFGPYSQVSGVAGPMVQYWLSDRVNLRAGGGVGFWSSDDDHETAFGLMLGVGVTVFNRGKHNLQIGFDYAPVFTDSRIHNIGFTFGYQFL
jgi:hypothetical protein